MPNKKPTFAHVKETGESTYAVIIDVSGHVIKGDEPEAMGGGNFGPAPYDLLLAAFGECTAMTVRWYARKQKWPLDKVEVKLSHQKIGRVDTFEKEVIVYGDKLTDDQRTELIKSASKCPIQRTLQSDIVIKEIVK